MQMSVLEAEVASFLNRSTTGLTDKVPTFIGLAATTIQAKLNLKGMECTAKHTLAVPIAGAYRGEGYAVAQPDNVIWTKIANPFGAQAYKFKSYRQGWVYDSSDEKRLRMLYLEKALFEKAILTTDTTQIVVSAGDLIIRDNESVTGIPLLVTHYGDELIFYPRTDTAGVGHYILMDFYGVVDYSNTADSYEDYLLIFGWKALLYGALLEAVPWLGKIDLRVEKWEDRYVEGLSDLRAISTSQDHTHVMV